MRLLLLAPIGVSGGIATWARIFRDEASEGTEIVCIDTSSNYVVLGGKRTFRSAILGMRDGLRRLTQVIHQVRATRPDAIYLTCAPSIGFWVRDLSIIALMHLFRVPTVIHLHGGNICGFFGAGPLRRGLVRRVLGHVCLLICITKPVESVAKKCLPRTDVVYIPNMMSTEFLHASARRGEPSRPPRPLVLHVGWQAPRKGTLDVLSVAARLPQADFVLVGEIPPDAQAKIDEALRLLGDPFNVYFAGPLFGSDLLHLYARATVFLLPSYEEGFPMVILEAMSNRLPVVATDVGEIATMLDTHALEPAGVTASRDSQSLVDELVELTWDLISDPIRNENMGRSGRNRVERLYAAKIVVPLIERSLDRAIGRSVKH